MQKIKNYINGELFPPVEGKYVENINPALGKPYSYRPESSSADLDLAMDAAQKAFPAWAALSASERGAYLLRIAELIRLQSERLALAESIDNGKPIALARQVDIPRAAQNFEFFAMAIQQWSNEAHPMPGHAINYTLRQPLGVVACISPWNLPLYLFTWKIAPALAAGNCVVAKPSEITPMTAYLLSEICIEAKLPAGVLNILHGTGAAVGAPLVAHPSIKAISFTGGTATGRHIAAQAAPEFKKLSLELGGKNPVLLFDDAPYEEALQTILRSSFANQGQICLCGSRILVQKGIYERFRSDFVEATKALRIGHPLEASSQVGAVVSEAQLEKICAYIELARQEGGTILCGGQRYQAPAPCEAGYYIKPTIIEGLGPNCQVNQEEIFGPVVTLQSFETEEEALALANNSNYGLSATIWTENLGRAHRLAERIEAGVVWVNCWLLRDLRTPFGGVKQSGIGREGGWEALRFFTEAKNVCINYKQSTR